MPELIEPLEILARSNVNLVLGNEHHTKILRIVTARLASRSHIYHMIGPDDDGNMPIEIRNPEGYKLRTTLKKGFNYSFKDIEVIIQRMRPFLKPVRVANYFLASNSEILKNKIQDYVVLKEDNALAEDYLERVRELRKK